MPKVTVIMPVYNDEKYVEETIESVLNQPFQDFELLIVNDASTDGSVEIINKKSKEDKRIKVLNNEINSGRTVSVNKGIEASKGDYVTFLDADDPIVEERLDEQVKFMEEHPEVGMSYSDMKRFYEDGSENIKEAVDFEDYDEPLKRLKKSAEGKKEVDQAYKLLDSESYIIGASVFFKRKVIESGIRFDPNLRNAGDCDFNFQVIGAGFKIKRIPKPLYLYRKHPEQKSANLEKMKIATDYITKKLHEGKYFK